VLVLLVSLRATEQVKAQDGRFPPQSQTKVRETLIRQLTEEGFDPAFVRSLLCDKRWELSFLVLEKNLVYRESKANYLHFLDGYSSSLAREFLRENLVFLDKTERRYGVEKEIIVAILLVESSLGRYMDKYPVFNTLSSLSQSSHPDVFPLAVKHLKAIYPDVREDRLRDRAERKSRWAFKELKAFLEIGLRENMEIHEMKGSWAGAFGLPQFVPTSYLNYAVDGDGDTRVHLHNRHDAMASVANYLKVHGWKPGLMDKERMKILFRYNRSRLYGETILECAKKLRTDPSSSVRVIGDQG
jgi:membrane-bound lytic murein transglycosylase B